MWNVFKFFFVWFCLAAVTFLVGVYLLGVAHPGAAHGMARARHSASPDPGAVLAVLVPFLMCVPAYFIARPKSE